MQQKTIATANIPDLRNFSIALTDWEIADRIDG